MVYDLNDFLIFALDFIGLCYVGEPTFACIASNCTSFSLISFFRFSISRVNRLTVVSCKRNMNTFKQTE